MRVVMTLLARDEADVVDAQLAFHLAAGVDFVIATDHRSVDGTTEILERHERAGHLRLLREDGDVVRQAPWVTRMARLAATEHGADWVVNADADEFWWPRAGSLQDVLAAVPERCDAVRVPTLTFVPRPDDGRPFAERMTARLATAAPINAPTTPYRAVHNVAHRASPTVVVGQGNHAVSGLRGRPFPGSAAIETLHFPFRSSAQAAVKHANALASWRGNLRGDLARARRFAAEGRPRAFYDEVVVDDDALRRGLEGGWLQEDVRIRDALRALAAGATPPRAATDGAASFAIASSCVAEAELVRLQRRVDVLAARVAASERA